MGRLLGCAALVWLAAAVAAGQGGAHASHERLGGVRGEAARLLESQANRDRAWGAHLAGRNGLKDLAPALVRTLEDPALADGPEEKIVRQAALDALIRLGARVPAETLRALPQGFADESVILLAAAPADNQAALLEMFSSWAGEGGWGAHWLAVGNLLAETRARGFAALLLRDLKVEADIAVLDHDGNQGFGFNGGGGCGCGGGFSPPPEGFPPVSYYGLTSGAARDAVVVAPGRRPVFYLRSASPGGARDYGTPFERDIVRVEYLAHLLDTTEDGLDFDPRVAESIVCKDARQCRRELLGVRARVERSYAALVGRLVEKGLLDGAGDAPASPPMTFTLYDERRRRTFPLPGALKGVAVRVVNMEPEDAADAEAEAGEP